MSSLAVIMDNRSSTNLTFDYSTSVEELFRDTLEDFRQFWGLLLTVYKPLEVSVLFVGLLGNVLALSTLARSKKMVTPSFVYHRVLVGADLAFCVNFFLNEIAERWLTVSGEHCEHKELVQYVFKYWSAAFYSGIMYLAVNNICGYLLLYMTLVIATDRTLALLWFKSYHYWNHRRVAWGMVTISVLLSVGLHSWTCFVEKTVVNEPWYKMDGGADDDESNSTAAPPSSLCWNESITGYQWINRENLGETYTKAARARNAYNGAIRIVYPILLSLLTMAVFYGLIKRQRRRRRTRARTLTSSFFVVQGDNASMSVTATSFAFSAANSPQTTITTVRARQRTKHVCERVLFFLMVAVVVLAFVQVSASESKRLLHLLFPPEVLLRERVANRALPIETRLGDFKLVLYGHQIVKLVSNFCTVIDRSFVCILYMAMNKLFRREALALLRRIYRRCSTNCGACWFVEDRRRIRRRPAVDGEDEFSQVDNNNTIGADSSMSNSIGGQHRGLVRGACSAENSAYLRIPSSPAFSGGNRSTTSIDRALCALQSV